MKLLAIAAVSTLLVMGTAQAQMLRAPAAGTLYGELGYTHLEIEETGLSVKPGVLRGLVGYNVNPNFAVEGMLGFGVRKDSTNTSFGGLPVGVEGEVRHLAGIYITPKAMIGNAFELFGRLGYAETRLRTSASVAGLSATGTDSGSDFSYGLGAKFNISPQLYVGGDYMRFYDKEDTNIDGLTVSVGYRF